MLPTQLIHLAARLSLGKEMGLAVTLLKLICDAIRRQDVQNVTLFVFKHLPKTWRHPEGPTTEVEFVDMVKTGEVFLKKVEAAVSR